MISLSVICRSGLSYSLFSVLIRAALDEKCRSDDLSTSFNVFILNLITLNVYGESDTYSGNEQQDVSKSKRERRDC